MNLLTSSFLLQGRKATLHFSKWRKFAQNYRMMLTRIWRRKSQSYRTRDVRMCGFMYGMRDADKPWLNSV